MKTIFRTLLLLTLSSGAYAGLKSRILHINAPETIDETYEVLIAKNKSILKVDPSNTELVEKLYDAEAYNSVVDLEIENEKLLGLEVIESGDNLLDFYPNEALHPMKNYTPSNVESVELATQLFGKLLKRSKPFSQCFNRAHIWSKQMYDSHKVESMKIFIFYTKKYTREISGKWWFHVAPMIDVNGQYYVMDKEFTRKPVTDVEWEKIFTKKMVKKGIEGYRCKVIQNIKEYYDQDNQREEYCNILVTNMYYWAPIDMSRLDKSGTEKTKFSNRDLKQATRNVFWGWRKVYKRLKVKN